MNNYIDIKFNGMPRLYEIKDIEKEESNLYFFINEKDLVATFNKLKITKENKKYMIKKLDLFFSPYAHDICLEGVNYKEEKNEVDKDFPFKDDLPFICLLEYTDELNPNENKKDFYFFTDEGDKEFVMEDLNIEIENWQKYKTLEINRNIFSSYAINCIKKGRKTLNGSL